MASSLVADYTDSEGEGGNEVEEDKNDDDEDCAVAVTHDNNHNHSRSSFGNFFGSEGPEPGGGHDHEDSSSSDDDDEDDDGTGQGSAMDEMIPLDNPFRPLHPGDMSVIPVEAKDSVLRVEFRENEAQKTAVLERHVKMSQLVSSSSTLPVSTVNGKKMCWYQRRFGKCRFGHKCKYAHDTDTAVIAPEAQVPGTDGASSSSSSKPPRKSFEPVAFDLKERKRANPFSMDNYDWDSSSSSTLVGVLSSAGTLNGSKSKLATSSEQKKSREGSDEDEDDKGKGKGRSGKQKNKRPGLPQGLVPGKKTMNMYYEHKK